MKRKTETSSEEDFQISRKQKMKDQMRKKQKREKNMMRSKNLNPNDIIDFYEEMYD